MDKISPESLRDEVQALFSDDENINIVLYHRPYSDGDKGMLSIQSHLLHNRNGINVMKEYIDRVVDFLEEKGFEVNLTYASSSSGSPIEGDIIAFRPAKEE